MPGVRAPDRPGAVSAGPPEALRQSTLSPPVLPARGLISTAREWAEGAGETRPRP